MAEEIQRKVKLVFDADTNRAKQSVQELYNILDKISQSKGQFSGIQLEKDLQEAALAASHLKANLQDAFNVNTGKLDLNKFNSNLQKSRMSLQDYQRILSQCGPSGQQAFSQLAQSIVTADTHVIRLSDKIKAMGTTLANTFKWQLSSSFVNGISNALSNAYSYAQDLNQSLNDIRVVTGYSVDKMKDFAKEANKSAQALSSTTTEYTDAALIFYQQGGFTDAEIQRRTDAVIKLSRVTGESVKQVSNYMTAIWNNFAESSGKPVEYFADVLAKLGAATASSSEEIAGGLEKFSAIAETVGLSYEYAASALATITAQTRQSEDVVGTALKTIFARIQGLQLGETLEDGVTLNKYSEALKTVGVSIFEANGEMRKMDSIIDDLGAKWQTLSKAEQTALAQTVAGTRQYTQLMALMDNWKDFKINVDLAVNADGTLENQFAIVEESWSAASKRLRASSEDLYDSLINDEAFIKLTDFFSQFVRSLTKVIDGMGGFKGLLTVVASILTQVYQNQLGSMFDSIGLKMQRLFTGTNAGLNETKKQAAAMLGDVYRQDGTMAGGVQAAIAQDMGALNEEYLRQTQKMGPYQKQIAEYLLQQQQTLQKSVIAQGDLVKKKEEEFKIAQKNATVDVLHGGTKNKDTGTITYEGDRKKNLALSTFVRQSGQEKSSGMETDRSTGAVTFKDEAAALQVQKAAMDSYIQSMTQAKMMTQGLIDPLAALNVPGLENLITQMNTIGDTASNAALDTEIFSKSFKDLNIISDTVDKSVVSLQAFEDTLAAQGKTFESAFGPKVAAQVKEYKARLLDAQKAQKGMATAMRDIEKAQKVINDDGASDKKKAQARNQLASAQERLKVSTNQYRAAVEGVTIAENGSEIKGKSLSEILEICHNNATKLFNT